MEMDYFQNNSPGGVFTFDNVFTGELPPSPAPPATGLHPLNWDMSPPAASQTVADRSADFQTVYYQGYFGQDTWQMTNKLTLSLGLRYEIPGVYVRAHGWADTFNPKETNPIVNVPGAFDLVNTPQHPSSGATNEVWTDFEPRLGLAYRLTDKTVLRGAWGRYVTPVGLAFLQRTVTGGH